MSLTCPIVLPCNTYTLKMKLLLTYLAIGFMMVAAWDFKALTDQSSMSITGTSTVHDWESNVASFEVTGRYEDDRFLNVRAVIPAHKIESGNGIMDDKTYDALKAEKHPNIIFAAPELLIRNGKAQGKGTLKIAGVSKDIAIDAVSKHTSSGMIQVKGKVSLKMSDFGIEPPKAMFGTLTTGDLVTINYELTLTK